MNIKHICDDSNSNEWFEVDGVTYGVSLDYVLMNVDGIPLDTFVDDKSVARNEEILNELLKIIGG